MLTYCLVVILVTTGVTSEYLLAEYAPKHDDYKPAQYHFSYGVSDHSTGDHKHHWETRDGDFVKGEYGLLQPDGVTRIVEYTSDPHNGFQAKVHKIGPGVHPHPELTTGTAVYGSHHGLYEKHVPKPIVQHDPTLHYGNVEPVIDAHLGQQLVAAPYYPEQPHHHVQLAQREPFHIPQQEHKIVQPPYIPQITPQPVLHQIHHHEPTYQPLPEYIPQTNKFPEYQGFNRELTHEKLLKQNIQLLPSHSLLVNPPNYEQAYQNQPQPNPLVHYESNSGGQSREHYDYPIQNTQQTYEYTSQKYEQTKPQQLIEIPVEYAKAIEPQFNAQPIANHHQPLVNPENNFHSTILDLMKLIQQAKPGDQELHINPISEQEFSALENHFNGARKEVEQHSSPRVVELYYPQGDVTMREVVELGQGGYQPQLPIKPIFKRQNPEPTKKPQTTSIMNLLKTFWSNITQNQKRNTNSNEINPTNKQPGIPKWGDTIYNAGDPTAPRENETLVRQLNATCLYMRFNETTQSTEDGTRPNIYNAGDYSAQREPDELIRSVNVTCENLATEAIRNLTAGLDIYKYCGHCFEGYQPPQKDEAAGIPTVIEKPKLDNQQDSVQINLGAQNGLILQPEFYFGTPSNVFKRSPGGPRSYVGTTRFGG